MKTKPLFIQLSLAGVLLLGASANAQAKWWVDIRNDRINALQEQIAQGQDLNGIVHEGQTALTYAYREEALKAFDLIASQSNVNLNEANAYGETAILYPALAGDLKRVKMLVERGAMINRLGWTPLHYAAIKGHADIVKYLLEKGAWPNSPAPDGSSALLMAVNAGSLESAKALLAAGADPNAVNQQRVSALDLARKKGNQAMIELLSK
ncbi:ankyrin repeat domain-containing protein [Brackiella oedipodis]|uniref:ankyrin repeat domain-containing protein n=1 Tax=Brackiella oedipodis TaxID=124225 RepID=UPI0004905949|nr:ankyrin repeat domain-containing protein [Brackiella oedipodis]